MSEEAKALTCTKCNNKTFTIVKNCAYCTKCGHMEYVESDYEKVTMQLVACAVAARGGTKKPHVIEKGAYSWSPAYQDVLDLRRKYDEITSNIENALKKCKDEEVFNLLNELRS